MTYLGTSLYSLFDEKGWAFDAYEFENSNYKVQENLVDKY